MDNKLTQSQGAGDKKQIEVYKNESGCIVETEGIEPSSEKCDFENFYKLSRFFNFL